VAVLKRYGKQPDVVARVAGIIGDVAHDYTEEGVKASIEADATPALSDALRAHPQDGEVQFNALYALRWIACTGKEPERPSLEGVATVGDIETLIEVHMALSPLPPRSTQSIPPTAGGRVLLLSPFVTRKPLVLGGGLLVQRRWWCG